MLWAQGLYKCHCTWLILPAIVLNSKTWNRVVSDGKKLNRGSAWLALQPAQSIYGSLVLCWAPGMVLGEWEAVQPSPAHVLKIILKFTLLRTFILCNHLLSSLSDWLLLFTSEFSFVMAWCWPLPGIFHEHLLSCLMFVDFSCQSSAHPSSLSTLLGFLSTDSDYLLVLLLPLFSHPTLALSANSLAWALRSKIYPPLATIL